MLQHEVHHLSHPVGGKTRLRHTEIQLAHQAPGHGIAVQHGSALQRQRLEGVAHGVAQVQRLAQPLFQRVLIDDALLHTHALLHHAAQLGQLRLLYVEAQQAAEHVIGGNEAMLQHLSIAREQVLGIEGAQESGVDNHGVGIAEDANLVLQPAVVEARLATHRGIDHGQQRGGNVDEVQAALEGAHGKAAQIGHHASAQVHHQRVAGGPMLLQLAPHLLHGVERLLLVTGADGDDCAAAHACQAAQQRQAQVAGMGVAHHEQAVVGCLLHGIGQRLCQTCREKHFLLFHLLLLIHFFCY